MALTLCLNVNSGPYRRPQGGFSHSRMSRAAKGAPPPVHNIAIWGGGGYGGLMHSYNYSQFKGNIGGSIGIGYECIDRHLLVHVGPEFRFLSNNDIINVNNLPDADNYKVTKIFDNYTQILYSMTLKISDICNLTYSIMTYST